ncbi:MAG: Rne/Rng family ribonuclease [Hoeflea sp.]|uniref:Rne/Rng family ribonuclease n=1 Tax=Hoeflea sp. TaxID=1940281 RepID=UPI0032EC75E4
MAEKMLVDASHPEETRVVVVRGNRIEEFDFESQHKKQLRGNIYLAKVTRVEPSLQAAFVDYGGNRHGFLAFSEIHPDYYQIPLADRQALLQAEAEDAANDPDFDSADEPEPAKQKGKGRSKAKSQDQQDGAEETGDDAKASKSRPRRSRRGKKAGEDQAEAETSTASADEAGSDGDTGSDASTTAAGTHTDATNDDKTVEGKSPDSDGGKDDGDDKPTEMAADVEADEISEPVSRRRRSKNDRDDGNGSDDNGGSDDDDVESVGSEDALEEVPSRTPRKPRKQYRIQEVIKRRQILLVQVVKEERGNKGAALTTYLSLAGRYSVLMPNTARGGGISRKITNLPDRKRLKEIARELEVPKGMGVILRTAGANRTKVEVKRDFEYLMRLWENVRNLTLKSIAPSLVYEEGSLIKRSIRDLYNKDISEIIVSGEEGYREAKDFMKMLMPSHAKVVQPYRDLHPIFARSGIEAQLDRMLQPQVTLKSGGYIIINQTEALVAIDVNSGRSTREHSIEDTALQTNLEAADEVARQLRLRDLAGLIVIDFIDMEENRNNRAVEKRMKECLKNDRARIQVGRISHFGLLEMSRQRIRASVLESTMQVCPTCGGAGHIRSQSSVALHVLRGVEEYLLKNTTHDISVRATADTTLYMLNHKRDTIVDLENRFGVSISFATDEDIGAQHFAIDRGAAVETPVNVDHITVNTPAYPEDDDEVDIPDDDSDETGDNEEADSGAEARSDDRNDDGTGRKRRRRRRRGGRKQDGDNGPQDNGQQNGGQQNGGQADERSASDDEDSSGETGDNDSQSSAGGSDGDGERRGKRRRRGKRGGRRNREDDNQSTGENASAGGNGSNADTAQAGDDTAATATSETPAAATEASSSEGSGSQPESGGEAEKKPARKRRRTKAQIAADKAAKAAEGAGANEPAEAPVTATDEQGSPSPDSQPDAGHEPETAAAAPEVVEDTGPEGKSEDETSGKSSRSTEAVATAPVVTSSSDQSDKKEKPKKAGWWQKRGFF